MKGSPFNNITGQCFGRFNRSGKLDAPLFFERSNQSNISEFSVESQESRESDQEALNNGVKPIPAALKLATLEALTLTPQHSIQAKALVQLQKGSPKVNLTPSQRRTADQVTTFNEAVSKKRKFKIISKAKEPNNTAQSGTQNGRPL